MTILVAGDAYVDIVPLGVSSLPAPGLEILSSRIESQPGGSAGYVTAGLVALGHDVKVVSVVGLDSRGAFWKNAISALGADVRAVKRYKVATGISVVLPSTNDRSFITQLGANLYPRRLPRLQTVRQVVISGLLQVPGLWSSDVVADLQWYRRRGVPVIVDSNWTSSLEGHEFLREVLSQTSVVFLNAFEVCSLFQEADPIQAAKRAVFGMPNLSVVVKLGAEGAAVITDKEIVQRKAVDLLTVDSLNGAGDFFLAGFLHAVASGMGIGEALAFSNCIAAAAISTGSYFDRLERIQRCIAVPQLTPEYLRSIGLAVAKSDADTMFLTSEHSA